MDFGLLLMSRIFKFISCEKEKRKKRGREENSINAIKWVLRRYDAVRRFNLFQIFKVKKSRPEFDVDIPSWKIIAKFNIFQVDRFKIYSTFQSLTSKVL